MTAAAPQEPSTGPYHTGHPYPPGPPPPAGPAYPPGRPVAAPPALAPSGQPLASFVDRLAAYLLDGLVLTVLAVLLTLPAAALFVLIVIPDAFEVLPDGTVVNRMDLVEFIVPLLLFQLALVALLLAVSYVYFVEMMWRTGQTLGKRVMRLAVAPLDPAGRLDRPAAAKRFLVHHVVGSVVPFFAFVDGLWQLWDKPYQQCLHDKAAATVVVKVPAR